jgi:hypothetical protein
MGGIGKKLGKAIKKAGKAVEKAGRNAGKAVEKAAHDTGKTVEKAAQDTGKTVEKAAQDAGKTVEKAAQDTGKTAEKAAQDTGKTVEKAAQDTGKTLEKAAQDTGKTYEKAGQDLHAAGRAIGRYAERQLRGWGDTLSDAERRVREGKIVDAIWHASIDPLKHTEENAAKAAQESSILRTVGQVAATVYGGPGGAAAFAAWYAYRQTGDVELALKIGIITGATSAGFSAVGQLPSDTAGQIAQKAIATGAIGGMAVAAAGGDEEAIREGFLRAGGMVLVQEAYASYTDHPLDPRASEGEPYCMATVGEKCSPELSAYERDANGNIRYDEHGSPRVDVTKTDVRRPHVGTWSKAGDAPLIGAGEQSGSMVLASKIPGVNAMSILHDKFAVSWDLNTFTSVATIAPAIVVTYWGTGAPYYDTLRRTATPKEQGSSSP